MGRVTKHGINDGAGPGSPVSVLNLKLIGMVVGGVDIDTAASTGGRTVSAAAAVIVRRFGTVGEAGEDGAKVAGAILVLLGLEPSVADLVDAGEGVLVSKVVAVLVRCVGEGHGK